MLGAASFHTHKEEITRKGGGERGRKFRVWVVAKKKKVFFILFCVARKSPHFLSLSVCPTLSTSPFPWGMSPK